MSEEDDLFFFESDHLALKGNKDYGEVLKTLVILTAQREKAIKDFNKVVECKKQSLENPLQVLERLKTEQNLGVPPMFETAKLPKIDLKKYNVFIPEHELREIYTDTKLEKDDAKLKPTQNNNNKAWSSEEQKRLEELLIIYPPEPVEMKRFQKIANALGNRTTQQVSSRVQKYFLKLYKAGLPIPGRIPKSGEKYKKSSLHKHQRHNHYLWKPTTFFPDLCVPVQMTDLDEIPGPSGSSDGLYGSQPGPSTSTDGLYGSQPGAPNSSNYLLPSEYSQNLHDLGVESAKKSESEIKLDLLKRLKVEKSKETEDGYVMFQHIGFKCDLCEEDPILGSRWHCTRCMVSVDFCTDCMLSQMCSENPHSFSHGFVVYRDDSNVPIHTNSEANELEFNKYSNNFGQSDDEDGKMDEDSSSD